MEAKRLAGLGVEIMRLRGRTVGRAAGRPPMMNPQRGRPWKRPMGGGGFSNEWMRPLPLPPLWRIIFGLGHLDKYKK